MNQRTVSINTTGAAGSATGQATFGGLNAVLLDAISVDYAGTAPATTVITISRPDVWGAPNIVIPAGNTDRIIYPRTTVVDLNSAAIAGAPPVPVLFYGAVIVAVSASNALTPAATVRFFFLNS